MFSISIEPSPLKVLLLLICAVISADYHYLDTEIIIFA